MSNTFHRPLMWVKKIQPNMNPFKHEKMEESSGRTTEEVLFQDVTKMCKQVFWNWQLVKLVCEYQFIEYLKKSIIL